MRRAALLCLLTGCFVDRPPDFDGVTTSSTSSGTTSTTSASSTTTTTAPSTGTDPGATSTSTGPDSTSGPVTATDTTAASSGSSSGGELPCPKLLLETNFDSPPAFTQFSGSWSAANGVYGTIPGDDASVALLPDFDLDAFTFSTQLRLDTPTSTAGLVVHTSGDVANLTAVLIQLTAGSESVTINGFVNGEPVDYSKLKIPPPPFGVWIDLAVSVNKQNVSVALDGHSIGFTPTQVQHGAVGLIAQNGAGSFNELRLCSQ